ncbi:MAG: hypothetical protein A2144_12255 [Chloroflexi bacterium RBG_16_50_9]|nr:MAG: hypothetical protein A2144_12255 [Chloroflexi bacterium RBG_16_50_9]
MSAFPGCSDRRKTGAAVLPPGPAAAQPGETRGPACSPDVVNRLAEIMVFEIDFGSELLLESFFCSRGDIYAKGVASSPILAPAVRHFANATVPMLWK